MQARNYTGSGVRRSKRHNVNTFFFLLLMIAGKSFMDVQVEDYDFMKISTIVSYIFLSMRRGVLWL